MCVEEIEDSCWIDLDFSVIVFDEIVFGIGFGYEINGIFYFCVVVFVD